MSAGQLHVDAGQISRCGAGITDAAQQLQSHIQSFQSQLGGYGNVFGTDAVSSLISGIYQAISQAAMQSYGDNLKALGAHGERVKIMGAGYKQAEDVAVTEVNRVREILG
jgi:hypothetical protein